MKYLPLFLLWAAITAPVVATGGYLYKHLTPVVVTETKFVVVTPTVTPTATPSAALKAPAVYKSYVVPTTKTGGVK